MGPPRATGPFRYDDHELDPGTSTLTCRYELDGRRFAERFTFEGVAADRWEAPGVAAAARWVFLLAGVSYYKTGAPPAVDLGATATTAAERGFLTAFYRHGLAEFAHRNGLDLSGLPVAGPDAGPPDAGPPPGGPPGPGRPLVPFGGGIDSIVTAEAVGRSHPGAALVVVARPGDRFAAIEAPAALTGLPVRRVGRAIDAQLLDGAAHGFLNGHVPVTGILSAVAVLAAVLGGHDAVVMSNEWSASSPTTTADGVEVNHQWSKGAAFESGFRAALAASAAAGGAALPDYFSFLRPYSELWVARRFAALPRYLPAFRSCNRAFALDPARRLDHWCGTCDKCCFIDLILSPFVPARDLAAVFGGREPLADPARRPTFSTLLGLSGAPKPFECVGDVGECRAAAVLGAARADRAGGPLADLAAGAERAAGGTDLAAAAAALLEPLGPHHVPDAYAPVDQLV